MLGVLAACAAHGASDAAPPDASVLSETMTPADAEPQTTPPTTAPAPLPVPSVSAGPATTIVAPPLIPPAIASNPVPVVVAPPAVAPAVVEAPVVVRAPQPPTAGGIVESRSTTVSGFGRSWTVVTPTAPGAKRPLIIVLHGRGGTGAAMRTLGFDELVGNAGAVVAYPDALGGSWNDGRSGVDAMANQQKIDDVGFVQTIIADAVVHDGVDQQRVALVGHSNGAMLAAKVGCIHADQVSALVLVSGVGGAELPDTCKPSRPVSVLETHGLRDPMVPYNGGQVGSVDGRARGAAAPVKTMLDLWRSQDGCADVTDRVIPGTVPVVTEQTSTGCKAGIEVVHFRFDDPTHGWPTLTGWDASSAAKKFLARHLALV